MKEQKLNIWQLPSYSVICIPTNGTVNRKDEAVMGRGVALQCAARFPEVPKQLASLLSTFGNNVHPLGWHTYKATGIQYYLVSFPTKQHWSSMSSLELIARSAEQLNMMLKQEPFYNADAIYLPKPGCGNGGLEWKMVKPRIESILKSDKFVIVSQATQHSIQL